MTPSEQRNLLYVILGAGVLYVIVRGLGAESFWLGVLEGSVVVSAIGVLALAFERLRANLFSPVGWGALALGGGIVVAGRWWLL